jgi:hypothetical protein
VTTVPTAKTTAAIPYSTLEPPTAAIPTHIVKKANMADKKIRTLLLAAPLIAPAYGLGCRG